jgi:hypothetical protein
MKSFCQPCVATLLNLYFCRYSTLELPFWVCQPSWQPLLEIALGLLRPRRTKRSAVTVESYTGWSQTHDPFTWRTEADDLIFGANDDLNQNCDTHSATVAATVSLQCNHQCIFL